jgi:hypothetical protein
MKGLENDTYVWLLIISNLIALLQLFAASRWPRITRLSFFLLFAWACWMNWQTSQHEPQMYLQYADLTFSNWYRDFINGWFANNIETAVGFIATCQGLIAVSFLLKGWLYRAGSVGAILFLLAILPLGVGSGFPCTAFMAAAIFILLRQPGAGYIWQSKASVARHRARAGVGSFM